MRVSYKEKTYDIARILQRPFFREFHFDADKSDAQILKSLSMTTEDSVD